MNDMKVPTSLEVFVAATSWDEAKAIACALAENRIAIGPRHQSREDAWSWCSKLNAFSKPLDRNIVYHVRVSWHWGPDCKIFNYQKMPLDA